MLPALHVQTGLTPVQVHKPHDRVALTRLLNIVKTLLKLLICLQMSELEDKASSASERLREEYRKHVQTQISHDLVDTISALEQHQEHLLQLCDQLKLAKQQVRVGHVLVSVGVL